MSKAIGVPIEPEISMDKLKQDIVEGNIDGAVKALYSVSDSKKESILQNLKTEGVSAENLKRVEDKVFASELGKRKRLGGRKSRKATKGGRKTRKGKTSRRH
jgi:hypothetical protein